VRATQMLQTVAKEALASAGTCGVVCARPQEVRRTDLLSRRAHGIPGRSHFGRLRCDRRQKVSGELLLVNLAEWLSACPRRL